MTIRIILIFLVVMLVLGMIGKWRLPRVPRRKPGTAIEPARKCVACGAYTVGKERAPCTRPDCPAR